MSRHDWPTGLVTALVSPMNADGIDVAATQQLIERQVQAGVGGVLVAGGTGEHGAWFKRLQAQELAKDPYLAALLMWLKAENGPDAEFLVADGLAEPKYLDWPRERLQRARRRAIDDGWIVQIRKPVRRVAALYRWGPTASGLRDSVPYPQ